MRISAIFISVGVILWSVAAMAQGVDTGITINSPSEIPGRRLDLIRVAFDANELPTTMPNSVTPVANPLGGRGLNVSHVERFVSNMIDGQSNSADLYFADSPNQNRLVIVNMGHQTTANCVWANYPPEYNTINLLRALLGQGYSILAMDMPSCGLLVGPTGHPNLIMNRIGASALQLFFEPMTRAINWLEANRPFADYNMTGLSGGGWTTVAYPALDPRIRTSIPVSGGVPGEQFLFLTHPQLIGGGDCNRPCYAEMGVLAFYTVAGYLDIFLMDGYGFGRLHQTIYNRYDDCCFGENQWNNGYGFGDFRVLFGGTPQCDGHDPCSWDNYVAALTRQIAAAQVNLQPSNNPPIIIDNCAKGHAISDCMVNRIVSILQGEGPRVVGRRLW